MAIIDNAVEIRFISSIFINLYIDAKKYHFVTDYKYIIGGGRNTIKTLPEPARIDLFPLLILVCSETI